VGKWPSSLVPAVARYAASRGLDVEALAWRFELPPDAAKREQVEVAFETPNEILQAVARGLGEDDVALHVAASLTFGRHALVALAVRSSATVRDALGLLARWTPLLHPDLRGALGDDARWCLSALGRPRGLGRYVHEAVLGHVLARLRDAAGDVTPSGIWFAHARPPQVEPLARFFGTAAIAFGAEDSGLAFSSDVLDRALPGADERTAPTIAALVDAALPGPAPESLSKRVADRIAATLPEGANVHDVARALHLSSRTLQRRLEQEGTRFGEVLDGVRLDVARRLLADRTLALGDIAFRLGFADLATFSRAFKRWTGEPPGQWRRA
jgi:AraC-like DNA-binding protein